jgi:hypothetical protein
MGRAPCSAPSEFHWSPKASIRGFGRVPSRLRGRHRFLTRAMLALEPKSFVVATPASFELPDPPVSSPPTPSRRNDSSSSFLLPSSSPSLTRQGSHRQQHPLHSSHGTRLVGARTSVKLSRPSEHLRVARPGRDVAIYSSAVIQLSMSTRESADSHFSARHPDPVKGQIA